MKSEFILMTLGDYRGQSASPRPAAANVGEQAWRQSRERQVAQHSQQQSSAGMRPTPSMSMGPPQPSLPRSATARVMQQTPNIRMPPTPATHKVKPLLEEDSLFVEQDDDEDQQWNPVEEDEEMLGWDANAVYVIELPAMVVLIGVLTYSRRKMREQFLLLRESRRNRSGKLASRTPMPQVRVLKSLRRKGCLRYAVLSSY